jgi:hypothetical protein
VTFDEPSIGTANHIAVRLIIEGYEVTRARLHTDSSIINSLLEMDKDLERIILFTLRQDGHTMMQAITNCTTII